MSEAAERVALELQSLADEMRMTATPGGYLMIDRAALRDLAAALERGVAVLRGELAPGQLLAPAAPVALGDGLPPMPALQLGNLVVVDFAGIRSRRAVGLGGPGGAA